MPTIAEVIAAKKASATTNQGLANAPADLLGSPMGDRVVYMTEGPHHSKLVDSTGRFLKWLPKPESIGDRVELQEAINRIDPPGKSVGATAARRSAGIILRKELLELSELSELSKLSNEAPCGERRSLSQRQGEAIPMTPLNADLEATTWHQAMNSYETDLVVMRDPIEPEVAWLAVRPERSDLPPILLHRLPWAIWNYPTAPTETQPF